MQGFSPLYVKKFLTRVRLVQRCIRSFLACKRARVEVLLMKWEKAELQFIKRYVVGLGVMGVEYSHDSGGS